MISIEIAVNGHVLATVKATRAHFSFIAPSAVASIAVIGSFRFDYEYEIEYDFRISNQ